MTRPAKASASASIQTKAFGKLELTFTTKFDLAWNDRGSGANEDVAFWTPVPPDGFYALGTVGVNHHGDINGQVAALCVRSSSDGFEALAQSKGFERIWTDKGSGAKKDGSCWRPIAPAGYRALGDVFVDGYDKPSASMFRCVHEDLTYPAAVGKTIWEDRGSGADADFGSWEIAVPRRYIDSERGLFAPNTFVGRAGYTPPTGDPVVYCLNLPLPAEEDEDPPPPRLTSTAPPVAITPKKTDRVVYLPFTAIEDPERTVAWKVEHSPFYAVERQIAYKTEIYDYNQTSTPQMVVESITTGISKSVSETFSVNTGISVTAESGVDVGVASSKVSATITVELGWQRTTGVTEFEQRTVEKSIQVPPGKAVAMWAISYSLFIRRADNSFLPSTLVFEVDYFVHSEYPEGETIVEVPPQRRVVAG